MLNNAYLAIGFILGYKLLYAALVDKGNGIYQAYLPLKSLIGYNEFEWDALKEIRFKMLKDTKVEIGDFR